MFVDVMPVVRLDCCCRCAPLSSPSGLQKRLSVLCFSFADRAEPDSNDFSLVLCFFFSFCIIDYLQFLVTYMSGKSLEDNQVKCESPF